MPQGLLTLLRPDKNKHKVRDAQYVQVFRQYLIIM